MKKNFFSFLLSFLTIVALSSFKWVPLNYSNSGGTPYAKGTNDNTQSTSLTKGYGRLGVKANVINGSDVASIYINGEYSGKGSYLAFVKPGEYKVKAYCPECITEEKTVFVKSGEITDVAFHLLETEKKGILKISARRSDNYSTKIYINGKYYAQNDLNVELEPGTYEIKVEGEGYKSITEKIVISKGLTSVRNWNLQPLNQGTLTVSAYVKDGSSASIFIDGVFEQNGTAVKQLMPGTYVVEAAFVGYKSVKQKVTIGKGQNKNVTLILNKKQKDFEDSFASFDFDLGYDTEKYSAYIGVGISYNPEVGRVGFGFHVFGYHGIKKFAKEGYYYGDAAYDYEHGNPYGSFFYPVGFGIDVQPLIRLSRIFYINPSIGLIRLSLSADRKSGLNIFGGEFTNASSEAIFIGAQLGLRWKHFGIYVKPEYNINILQSTEWKTVIENGIPELELCKGFGCKIGIIAGF